MKNGRQILNMDRTPADNSSNLKGGFSLSKDSFVVNQTLVFQVKFCGKSPALRVASYVMADKLRISVNAEIQIVQGQSNKD